ncbi:MAG: AMP-binding protein, partial [Actinomycetes bacterium]
MDKSYEGIVLEGSSRTVPHLLVAAAGNYAPLIAITDGQKSVAYRDLPSLASAAALKLQKLGVAPDDRVMVVAENSFELLELLLGAAWLGAILVPVNPTSRAGQLRYLVESTEPRLILIDESVQARWSASGDQEYLEFTTQFIPTTNFDFSEVSKTEIDSVLVTSEPGSTLAILFTSGTTGKPKGVMCPQGQFVRWGEVVGKILKMSPGEVAQT